MKVLLSRNFIFPFSATLGFLVGSQMGIFSFLNMPILMLIMTLSLAGIDLSALKSVKKSLKPFLLGIGLNYFLIFFLFLVLGRLLGIDGKIWAGLVISAATPPGLAIIPFTLVVKGDLFYSSLATFSAFLAALIFTPWLAAIFIGADVVSFSSIFNLLFMLIVIPLIIGRIIRVVGWGSFARKIHGPVVNIGFGFIFAVILGVNKKFLLTNPDSLAKLFLLSVLVVFGLAFLMKYFLGKKGIQTDIKKSIVLIATIKNSIFGATAGLILFGSEGALAGTVFTFVTLAYLIFVDRIVK